jgi:hypothetical protein
MIHELGRAAICTFRPREGQQRELSGDLPLTAQAFMARRTRRNRKGIRCQSRLVSEESNPSGPVSLCYWIGSSRFKTHSKVRFVPGHRELQMILIQSSPHELTYPMIAPSLTFQSPQFGTTFAATDSRPDLSRSSISMISSPQSQRPATARRGVPSEKHDDQQ